MVSIAPIATGGRNLNTILKFTKSTHVSNRIARTNIAPNSTALKKDESPVAFSWVFQSVAQPISQRASTCHFWTTKRNCCVIATLLLRPPHSLCWCRIIGGVSDSQMATKGREIIRAVTRVETVLAVVNSLWRPTRTSKEENQILTALRPNTLTA